MADDHRKTLKEEFTDRLEKAKGRLQQSFPEIRQSIKTSGAVEAARKIIDPAQSIFKQFADDIQLKDLIAKAEALVANANLTLTKAASKDAAPTEARPIGAPSNEPSAKKAGVKKTPSKGTRLKKAVPKKTLSKKKKKRAPKRRVKTLS
jgi:hypothetical protein